MSAPLERREGPRTYKPRVFETCTNPKDPLFSFFVTDRRWRLLRRSSEDGPLQGPSLRKLVLGTGREVHALTYDELLQRSRVLDAEIPQSPYLGLLAARGSNLMDLHDVLSEIFVLEDPSAAQQFERVPSRILQINYAARLLGRELEKRHGWNPQDGFGMDNAKANAAISLCADAIKEITPPFI